MLLNHPSPCTHTGLYPFAHQSTVHKPGEWCQSESWETVLECKVNSHFSVMREVDLLFTGYELFAILFL